PPVPVVTEDFADGLPYLGHLVGADERPEALGDHRVGGKAAADPQVVTDVAGLRVPYGRERDVVDLVVRALRRAAADRRLELPRQVGQLRVADVVLGDRGDLRRRVDQLVGGQASKRTAEDDPGRVAAGLGGGQADGLQGLPDRGDRLDLDPVQLDVLPVGDVGGAPRVPDGDVGDDPQLLARQLAAVDADPEHEVAVVEVLRLEDGGLAAVDAGAPLGVEAVPAEAPPPVGGVQ